MERIIAATGLLLVRCRQTKLVRRYEDVFVLQFDRKAEIFPNRFQVRLKHLRIVTNGNLDLTDEDELVAFGVGTFQITV